MDSNKYIKLAELNGKQFKMLKSRGFTWKLWNNEERKMLVSEKWQQGYKKRYALETDKGLLEVSQRQMGSILEAVLSNGEAKPVGSTFAVKSDGKEIPDYYFNTANNTEGAGFNKFLENKEKLKREAPEPTKDGFAEPERTQEDPF